jgi:hypothetical protein
LRRFIVGLPTNALNKIFMSLYWGMYRNIMILLLKSCLKKQVQSSTNEDLKTALKDKGLYHTSLKQKPSVWNVRELQQSWICQ